MMCYRCGHPGHVALECTQGAHNQWKQAGGTQIGWDKCGDGHVIEEMDCSFSWRYKVTV